MPDTNPFNFGDLALDQAFTDRDAELAELTSDVRNGQNVVIFAPRRYGKTSLVWRAAQRLEHQGVLTAQLDLMRETARAAGRDPAALEYTRWGAIDMTADDVAAHAANGVTRLVVGPASTEESEQKDQISAFAARLALG